MKNKIIGLLALVIFNLCYCKSIAQSKVEQLSDTEANKLHAIDLTWGLQIVKYQDLVISPMIYTGSDAGYLRLRYLRSTKLDRWMGAIKYSGVSVSPPILISSPAFGERRESKMNDLAISIAYLRKVYQKNDLRFDAGSQLMVLYNELPVRMGFGEEDSYFFETSFNIAGFAQYDLKKNLQLELQTAIPLIGLIARPEFAIVDNETIQGSDGLGYLFSKGTWHSWGEYFAINFQGSVRKQLGSSAYGLINYQLDYMHIDFPASIRRLTNTFSLTLGLNF